MKRLSLVLSLLAAATAVGYLVALDRQLRGSALDKAKKAVLDRQGVDATVVGRAILENHRETRHIAALGSSLYGDSAGLALKAESFLPDEKPKKDVVALLTVTAASMVTISTNGTSAQVIGEPVGVARDRAARLCFSRTIW